MGFFNKLRKKVRGQIAPVMTRRGDFLGGGGFLGRMPQTKPAITDMRFRGRMPQKRGGLADIIRRLQEQLRNQQMRAPQPMQELRAGDIMPNSPVVDRRPSPRMPAPPAVAPDIMPNLNPGMPRMAPPVMNQMQGEPRMMMAGGRDASMVDFLNSDPRQQMFGVETRIGMLENQLQEALANNDMQAYDMIVQQINDADAQRINIMNSMNPTPTIPDPIVDRMIEAGRGRTVSDMDRASLDDILSDLEKKN
tara:strand:+ start:233 stop:982 length:750 start_codon:yes stop_codon:yes gene_type:complete